jgi:hypothetical protein
LKEFAPPVPGDTAKGQPLASHRWNRGAVCFAGALFTSCRQAWPNWTGPPWPGWGRVENGQKMASFIFSLLVFALIFGLEAFIYKALKLEPDARVELAT